MIFRPFATPMDCAAKTLKKTLLHKVVQQFVTLEFHLNCWVSGNYIYPAPKIGSGSLWAHKVYITTMVLSCFIDVIPSRSHKIFMKSQQLPMKTQYIS